MKSLFSWIAIGAAVGLTSCQTARRSPQRGETPASRPSVQTVELRHVVVPAPSPRPRTPAATVARVGQVAPDFTLPGFHKGKFVKETLSKHRGRWVLLCFYPGDFTFV